MQQGAGMDIDALHSALVSLTLLPEEIRSARESLLASAGNGVALAQFLSEMERDLRIAKASLARDLGFNLCHCCWPPELMASDADGKLVCAARLEINPSSSSDSILLFVPAESGSNGENERLDSFTLLQKKKLLQLRDAAVDSITGVVRQNRTSCREEKSLGKDPADAGNDAYDRDSALALVSQERDALYEIDEALKRIEEGTYGVCEISGKRIPRTRLEAIPFARFTVECQAQIEQARKPSRVRQMATPLFSETDLNVDEDEGEDSEAGRDVAAEDSRGTKKRVLRFA